MGLQCIVSMMKTWPSRKLWAIFIACQIAGCTYLSYLKSQDVCLTSFGKVLIGGTRDLRFTNHSI